ncbi:hypothetical protein MJH12_00185 [bacterium]|nr:hypothetical protein [bacterium]
MKLKSLCFYLILMTCIPSSYSLGFIKHQVRRILRLDKRDKFDHRRCITKPELLYGHFVNSMVYPDEIHTFYINQRSPKSKNGIGRNLTPVVRRILSIDESFNRKFDSFSILKIKACIASESFLEPSYRSDRALMGLESNPNMNLQRKEKSFHYQPYR